MNDFLASACGDIGYYCGMGGLGAAAGLGWFLSIILA